MRERERGREREREGEGERERERTCEGKVDEFTHSLQALKIASKFVANRPPSDPVLD